MSKNNNVNPGQYKVGGRERVGEDIVQKDHKERFAKTKERSATPKGSGRKAAAKKR